MPHQNARAEMGENGLKGFSVPRQLPLQAPSPSTTQRPRLTLARPANPATVPCHGILQSYFSLVVGNGGDRLGMLSDGPPTNPSWTPILCVIGAFCVLVAFTGCKVDEPEEHH